MTDSNQMPTSKEISNELRRLEGLMAEDSPTIVKVTVEYSDGRRVNYDPSEVTGSEPVGIRLSPKELPKDEFYSKNDFNPRNEYHIRNIISLEEFKEKENIPRNPKYPCSSDILGKRPKKEEFKEKEKFPRNPKYLD